MRKSTKKIHVPEISLLPRPVECNREGRGLPVRLHRFNNCEEAALENARLPSQREVPDGDKYLVTIASP